MTVKPSLWTDKTRTMVITTVLSLLPVLQLMGVISLTGDGVAVLSFFITNTVTLLFYVMKPVDEGATNLLVPDDEPTSP